MQKYIFYIISGLFLTLSSFLYKYYDRSKNLENNLSVLRANQKAFMEENSSLKEENKVFRFNIDEVNLYNDSLVQKMNSIRKELGIKDSNLKQMQYLLSMPVKSDTIVFKDTVFCKPDLHIDTIVGDKWYNMDLKLVYPNIIYTKPTFISEKYIITSKKKETVNPPKKFFLFRWLQKKHWVVEVNIEEKNPYIHEINNKFIEIIE